MGREKKLPCSRKKAQAELGSVELDVCVLAATSAGFCLEKLRGFGAFVKTPASTLSNKNVFWNMCTLQLVYYSAEENLQKAVCNYHRTA